MSPESTPSRRALWLLPFRLLLPVSLSTAVRFTLSGASFAPTAVDVGYSTWWISTPRLPDYPPGDGTPSLPDCLLVPKLLPVPVYSACPTLISCAINKTFGLPCHQQSVHLGPAYTPRYRFVFCGLHHVTLCATHSPRGIVRIGSNTTRWSVTPFSGLKIHLQQTHVDHVRRSINNNYRA